MNRRTENAIDAVSNRLAELADLLRDVESERDAMEVELQSARENIDDLQSKVIDMDEDIKSLLQQIANGEAR
jgi:septal ring factor EnvC (AmiA/AmiB activator)